MKRNNKGISIMEAALAIGVIAIVSIGVLSLLGNNINITYTKSNDSFKGYKPFDWASPGGPGSGSGSSNGDAAIVETSGSPSDTETRIERNTGSGTSLPNQASTFEAVEVAGSNGLGRETTTSSASTSNTSGSSEPETTFTTGSSGRFISPYSNEVTGTRGAPSDPNSGQPSSTNNTGTASATNSTNIASTNTSTGKKPTIKGKKPSYVGVGTTGVPSSGVDTSRPVIPGGIKPSVIGAETSGVQSKAFKGETDISSSAPAQF